MKIQKYILMILIVAFPIFGVSSEVGMPPPDIPGSPPPKPMPPPDEPGISIFSIPLTTERTLIIESNSLTSEEMRSLEVYSIDQLGRNVQFINQNQIIK